MLTPRRIRRWSPLCLIVAVVVLAAAIITAAPVEAALPALLLLGAVVALTYDTGRQRATVEPPAGVSLALVAAPSDEGSEGRSRASDPHHFVAREFAAARRGRSVTLVMFGFSCFDEFVESEGAQAGTEAVREFGRVVTSMTRQMNLSARYGWRADSFLSVLSDANCEAARMFVHRVREAAAGSTARMPAIDVGIVTWQPHLATPDAFVKAAERALDAARGESIRRVGPYGRRQAQLG